MRGSESTIASGDIGLGPMLIFAVVAIFAALLFIEPAMNWFRRRAPAKPHRQYDLTEVSEGRAAEID